MHFDFLHQKISTLKFTQGLSKNIVLGWLTAEHFASVGLTPWLTPEHLASAELTAWLIPEPLVMSSLHDR